MPSPLTKPSLTSLVAFVMIVTVLYALSYAPAFRFSIDGPYGFDGFPDREGWQELYRPVEWLTDTPLREPLLSWAGLWGEYVEEDFRYRSDRRMQGEDPYARESGGGFSGGGSFGGGFGGSGFF